jgi:thiol-disulfide isomerase/thioredoxin
VAATEEVEQAGNEQYHSEHMGAIFKEGFSFSGYERDLLAMNAGDGTFLDVSGASGVDSISDGRGSVFADFDNDGDSDIFLTTAQREAHYLFRNNVGDENGFLRVTLEGTDAGRDAYGAVVRVKTSAGVQAKVKAGGSGYLSQHDGRLLFGLGKDERAEWVEVTWPGGGRQKLDSVVANSSIRVVEGSDGFTEVAESRFRLVDPLDPEEARLAAVGFRAGQIFPDIPLRTLDGTTLRLGDVLTPGRKSLVNLWATWCVPCAEEMPELQALHPGLRRSGVDLIGVSVDLDTVDNVPGYVGSREIGYPIYTTDPSVMETLFPRGEVVVPVTALLDETGRVLEIFSGWSPQSEQSLRALAIP